MEKTFKKGGNEEYLVKMLQESIIAEQAAGDFYRYIAEKIKNGNIRNRFMKFADEEAEKHKKLLNDRLKLIIGQTYNPNLSELDTNIKVSCFSLIGALNMAKESERKAIEFYTEARRKDVKYRKTYDQIIAEEKKHWSAIDKEKYYQEEMWEFYKDDIGVRLISLLMERYQRTL